MAPHPQVTSCDGSAYTWRISGASDSIFDERPLLLPSVSVICMQIEGESKPMVILGWFIFWRLIYTLRDNTYTLKLKLLPAFLPFIWTSEDSCSYSHAISKFGAWKWSARGICWFCSMMLITHSFSILIAFACPRMANKMAWAFAAEYRTT